MLDEVGRCGGGKQPSTFGRPASAASAAIRALKGLITCWNTLPEVPASKNYKIESASGIHISIYICDVQIPVI